MHFNSEFILPSVKLPYIFAQDKGLYYINLTLFVKIMWYFLIWTLFVNAEFNLENLNFDLIFFVNENFTLYLSFAQYYHVTTPTNIVSVHNNYSDLFIIIN